MSPRKKSAGTVHLLKDAAKKADVDPREAQALVNAIVRMLEKMPIGDKLRLTGLGVFTKYRVEAHVGRNPRTGEPVDVPAKDKVRFMPSDPLKDC